MGSLKDSVKKQINNDNRTQFSDTTATILSYDRTVNTCKIKYQNPNGDGYIYRGNVSIANTSGGIASGSIHAGQECSITFVNDNIYVPVITGITNCYYQERNCADQGAYVADDEVWKVGTPEHIIAMNLDWIDDDNTDLSKYESDFANYTNTDVDKTSMDIVTTLDKYQDDEVGMTNLKNKSTVKLRDNGDIDIFTSTNTGIRICKTGNIKFYCNDIEFTNSKDETTDKSISTQLKISQMMKICLAYDIIKEVDRYIKAIQNPPEKDKNNKNNSYKMSSANSRISEYETLKKEFYDVDVDKDKEIDKYVKLLQQFNDEFLDIAGELGVTIEGTLNTNISTSTEEGNKDNGNTGV